MEREAFLERLRARLAPAKPVGDAVSPNDEPQSSQGRRVVTGHDALASFGASGDHEAAADHGASADDETAADRGASTDGSVASDGELTELFVSRLSELGVEVREVATAAKARLAVERLVADRGWSHVACAPGTRWEGIAERWTVDAREADFGLCEADWAAAETGSVVVCSGAEVRRGYSLVPAAVGFFVARERILAGVGDVLRALPVDGRALPSCLTFVTGPSSTADLAAVHVVGVHGPGEVFVWVVGAAEPVSGLGRRPPQE